MGAPPMTQPATPPAAPPAPPAQDQPAATWDDLFKDQDPAKVKEALDNSRKWEQRAKENKTAAEKLAALEESQKTEAQKLADRATAAEKERDEARLDATRTRVALAKGLPPELADRLRGSSEEELTADAVALLALVPSGPPRPRADGDQGARQVAPKTDMNAAIRAAFGR